MDVLKTDKTLYGLRYAQVVVPLVKAVQGLDNSDKQLWEENKEMKTEIARLKEMIANFINMHPGNDIITSADEKSYLRPKAKPF